MDTRSARPPKAFAERSYPAPVLLGVDEEQREILSYVPGECVHPNNLRLIESTAALRRVGHLILSFHRAQAGFVPPPEPCWRSEGRDPEGSYEVLAHNDLAPWNLVAGSDGWVFIDWDLVAPGRRLWDLAWALHSFVGLWPDSTLDDETTIQRVSAFCDGAEVEVASRSKLLDVVVERTMRSAEVLREKAAGGDVHYQRLVGEGHADVWEQGSHHVRANKERWSQILQR